MSSWLHHGRRLALLISVGVVLAGCGSPNSIGNMPGPVRKIINTPTLSGQNIGANILQATGNEEYLGSGQIPGYYNYGPSYDNGSNTYYVTLEVPINVAGLEKSLHYLPHPIESTTIPEEVYINVPPLPNMAFDRLYFDPSTHLAPFSFKLLPNGQVLDVSWDAVLVNS
ncbi:hypothetical protein [Sulfobacillus thermosulfidooxidans]|uniref:hypothetical protein n=1 Tax=Sulfobacillus thermosulfidooxidans TaxID=28034 RepID=UPI0002D81941|nr:hypothetical protein [Sulfobacillus thermosulfidooxidans]